MKEKTAASICCNLLLFSGLRRLRQDLVSLISRFASRGAAQPLEIVSANQASATKKVAFQQFHLRYWSAVDTVTCSAAST
jgi:hypothetical protein